MLGQKAVGRKWRGEQRKGKKGSVCEKVMRERERGIERGDVGREG